MENVKQIDICTNTVDSGIVAETFSDLILNVAISIPCNKGRPVWNFTCNYIIKEFGNYDITHTLIETSLSRFSDKRKYKERKMFL